jgi:Ca2+-binding RTX toxin-like protein
MRSLRLVLVLSLSTLLVPATADAVVGCTFVGATVTVSADAAGGSPSVGRMGSEIWWGSQGLNQQCGSATVNNTDQINLTAAGTVNNVFFVLFGEGDLAPGLTNEAGTSDEIEIDVDGGGHTGTGDVIVVHTTDTPANVAIGDQLAGAGTDPGANVNVAADEGTPDVDLEFVNVEQLTFRGGPGGDVMSLAGGAGLIEPLPAAVDVGEFRGNQGNDTMTGSPAGETISGAEGSDTLSGGSGDDDFYPDSPDNPGDDSVNGGAGSSDRVIYYSSPENGIRLDLGAAGQQDTGAGLDTIASVERAIGGNGPDTLIGRDGPDSLNGSYGDDLIIGRGGDDFLMGSYDIDTVSYELPPAGSATGVTVDLTTQGIAVPDTSGGAGEDILDEFENVTGSPFADVLTGDDDANVFRGLGGIDTLSTAGGDDTLDVRDAGADTANCGAGADTVRRDEPGVDTIASDCEIALTLDTTIGGAPAGPTANTTPTLTLTSNEAGASFECSVDGAAFAACPASFSPGPLSDGAHSIRARALDALGNPDATPAEVTVVVDVTSPLVSGFSIARRFAVKAASAAAVPRGSRFKFELSEAARVQILVERVRPGRRVRGVCRKPTRKNRTRKRCKRYVRAGTLSFPGVAGPNSRAFSGRFGRRALKPGPYRATLRATDQVGNVSAVKRTTFRIVKPR